MKMLWKSFKELTIEELHQIYKLRVAVFVVEQNCAYQEVDDTDKIAFHLWLEDEEGMQAYMRIFPKNIDSKEFAFGRVLSMKRRCHVGSELLCEGIRIAKEKLNAQSISLEAQVYTRGLYDKAGFLQMSDVFLEDGIPHIQMRLEV